MGWKLKRIEIGGAKKRVKPNEEIDLNIVLDKEKRAVIHGEVKFPDGKPVYGAAVKLFEKKVYKDKVFDEEMDITNGRDKEIGKGKEKGREKEKGKEKCKEKGKEKGKEKCKEIGKEKGKEKGKEIGKGKEFGKGKEIGKGKEKEKGKCKPPRSEFVPVTFTFTDKYGQFLLGVKAEKEYLIKVFYYKPETTERPKEKSKERPKERLKESPKIKYPYDGNDDLLEEDDMDENIEIDESEIMDDEIDEIDDIDDTDEIDEDIEDDYE